MLSERFQNDGKQVIHLNRNQRLFKKQLENKLENGTYSFRKKICIICNSISFETLSEKDRYGLYMPVVICKNCGLIQTNPTMNEKNYIEFYENEYRQIYNEESEPSEKFFEEQYNHGKVIFEFIKKTIGQEINNKLIVEIGTGSGGILKFFEEKGNRVIGFDLEEKYLDFGKSKNLDLRKGVADNIVLDKKPDIVILSHVLEHFFNPITELEKIKRILSAESFVYIEVPGVKHLNLSYKQDFLLYLQNAHLYHFTLKSLCNCTSKAGFSLINGNELIQALYKIGGGDQKFSNDYLSSLNFLKKIEESHSKHFSLLRFTGTVFTIISEILRRTGTLHIGQSIFYKLQKSRDSDFN